MSGLALEARVAVAVARAELRRMSRYRLDLAATILLPFFQFVIPTLLLGATFFVRGRATGFARVTGTADVAGYFVLGAIVSALCFGAFWGAAFGFRREMMAGTLEPLWLAPARLSTVVTGYALASLATSAVAAAVLFGLGVLALHTAPWAALAVLVPVGLVLEAAMLGLTLLMTSATLLVREPNVIVDVGSYLFQAACGVLFPLAVMPRALVAAGLLLPATHAVDLLRVAGLGTRPLLPPAVEVALLVLEAALLVPLGLWVFGRTERRLRRLGTLGTY